jgi:uncharacterized protein YdaU (DUF1376 family)
MAKDLTYFKFVVSEWNDGDITTCSFAAQGLFANLCSLYWSREGDLTLEKAKKKLHKASEKIWSELQSENIFKVNSGKICINFLDEQLKNLDATSEQNSKAAKSRWNRKKKDAPAFRPHDERMASAMPIDKIRVDKNTYIQLCESVCEIFGREYVPDPQDRMPSLANWFATIESQVDRILQAWDIDTAIKQVNAYKKHCLETNRKKVGTDYKVADTLLQADWVGMTKVEMTPARADPYEEPRRNRELWTKQAWEEKYDHKLKTDNNFRKTFGYEELRNGGTVGGDTKGRKSA